MSQHLAIFIRAESLDAELDAISGAMTVALKGETFDTIYVVAGGHAKKDQERTKKRIVKRWKGHADAGKVTAYAPDKMVRTTGGLSIGEVAQYARATLLDRIVLGNGASRLRCLWRDDWLESVIALQSTISCTSTMDWWLADESAPWPSVPKGLRYRDLWLEPATTPLDPLIGSSEPMQTLKKKQLREVAPFPVPVLLVGETGTGKELCAQALHTMSGRTDGRLISINCALLDEHRAESTLFGHVKGAFTGASGTRTGRIREAVNGTLFLDEMLDLPRSVQAKLLRSLNHVEEAKLRVVPMGEADTRADDVDVRVVSAIQPGALESAIRSDLYHRLSWVRIEVPPLRERGADAVELAQAMLDRLNAGMPPAVEGATQPPIKLTADARKALKSSTFHEWPGNVRELRVVLFRAWLGAAHAREPTIGAKQLKSALDSREVAYANSGCLRSDVARYVVDRYEQTLSKHGRTPTGRVLGFKTKNPGQDAENYYKRHRKKLLKGYDNDE